MVEVAGSLGEQLGAALRTERFLRSTSQRELALELGVSKSFIGRLESGDLRGSAAAVARLVERLGLAFAIVVPDEDLGAALVDDSPEARELAERWRRSDSARRDDLGLDRLDPITADDAFDEPSWAAAGTAPRPTAPTEPDVHTDAHTDSHTDSHTDAHTGPDGAPVDCRAPSTPRAWGEQGGPEQDEPRPSWLLSSRTGSEELTVPGRPPPTRAGRRVVVGVPAAYRSLRLERFYDDPAVQVVVASWLRRAEAERVRDAAGRRMPAHVVCFPIQLPRMWWPCRHIGWDWRKRPIWSWRRHPLWVVQARLTGPNPPPVGAHPFGGYPMQGHPGEDIRGDWPPDPSTRAGRAGGAHWPA